MRKREGGGREGGREREREREKERVRKDKGDKREGGGRIEIKGLL